MYVSVKTRVAVLNIGLILLVSLILGSLSYFMIVDALKKIQTDNLSYIAQNKSDHLASMIRGKQTLLKQIAQGEVIKRYSKSYQDKLLQEYFTFYNSEFPSLSFINHQGVEELKVVNGVNHLDLTDMSHNKTYEDVTWKPNRIFTTLSLSEDNPQAPFLEVGYFRQNFFGDFEGIVIGRIALSRVLSHFREFELGETGFLMILDEMGNILSHPQQQSIMQPARVDGIESELILTNAVNMRSGVARATIQGIDGFIAYAPVPERNWTMLAVLPYSEFIATPQKFRNIFIVVLCFILIIGITLSLYTSMKLTRPILKLTRTSQLIAQGDLGQRVYINSNNEIGQLGKSFNTMASKLQQSKQALESDAKIREGLIRELEHKNNELERFTYTVSHDLKSPLVTVKGFIGLLRQDIKLGNQERIERDIMQISNAADKMASLLEDLLELSRIGRMSAEPQLIPLTDLFEEVVTLLQGQIMQTNATISIQSGMPSVLADRQRLFEVAQNLLDNALKFHIQGQVPQISVSAIEEKGKITCCVKDRGIGVDPKYQDRIFGLFDRIDQNIKGNGVGLALVKRIIEVHNGSIFVKSEGEGLGAEFCFSLPVVHQETQQ